MQLATLVDCRSTITLPVDPNQAAALPSWPLAACHLGRPKRINDVLCDWPNGNAFASIPEACRMKELDGCWNRSCTLIVGGKCLSAKTEGQDIDRPTLTTPPQYIMFDCLSCRSMSVRCAVGIHPIRSRHPSNARLAPNRRRALPCPQSYDNPV